VQAHWPEILAGKTVSFRYASWERMETVGFDIKKSKELRESGEDLVQVKMSASSFVIAALVNPLFFTFSSDGKFLRKMSGRVAPKKKVGESWKDLDADVVYHEN